MADDVRQRHRTHEVLTALAALGLLVLAGCTTLGPGLHKVHQFVFYGPEDTQTILADKEENQRRAFQTTRSRKALRWLLANRVRQGMSRQDVAKILGEDGVREENDRWLKTKSTLYRLDDELFAFGPDEGGDTIYLAFRNDKLVIFDPEQFEDK